MPVQSSPQPVTVDDVRKQVGAGNDDVTTARLTRCLALAQVELAGFTADYDSAVLAGTTIVAIPDVVRNEATIAVAAEIWAQQKAPNGVLNQQYATDDGVSAVPIRISADPLRPAYPLLGRWVDPVTFS